MGLELFNKRSHPQLFRRLSDEYFDLVIIGGGITGVSIFRDAALRGMRVALVEAHDFAAGTSGRSSKLIHGGIRYLKNMNFRRVWESCHERNLHIRLNKRLVQPQPFLIPFYGDHGNSPIKWRVGMWLYELMSGFKNYQYHRFLGTKDVLSIAPGLVGYGLVGGVLYYDAVVSDNRLTMETVKDGVRHGGLAINHASVTGFRKENNAIVGVTCSDEIGKSTYRVRARAVVNATGVWADPIRKLAQSEATNIVRLSRGTHLVFAQADVPLMVSTVFLSPIDRRALFLIKREGCFLFGTTDEWVNTEPDAPIPHQPDVTYLLESLRLFMPHCHLDTGKVQFVYSGFRAIPVDHGEPPDPSSATREDYIEIAPSGLITVVGGKLSTARIMAKRVLSKVIDAIGESASWAPCQTDKLPIGGSNEEIDEGQKRWSRQCPRLTKYFQTLYERYGLDADSICAESSQSYFDQESNHRIELLRPEFEYLCRNEMVCTLEDLMERRIGFLHWNNERRLAMLRSVKNIVQNELNTSPEEFEEAYREYTLHLKQFHTLPESASTM